MSQPHSNEEIRAEEQSSAAAGQTSAPLGDAPDRDAEVELHRKLQALQKELQTSGMAYAYLFREVKQLKKS